MGFQIVYFSTPDVFRGQKSNPKNVEVEYLENGTR